MKQLYRSLQALKGNPRYCVFTEPLWFIPFALYSPFLTLYMFSLGLEDAEIGILLSVGLFLQMIFALLGGVLTDKFGRRRTTFYADLLSWSIPVLIWAFAQDFQWFLIATIFSSTGRISAVSWQCLLVEDAEPSSIVQIYNFVHIAGLLSVFFAPISGFFIEQYSLVPVMRVLLVITFVSMTLKFVLLYIYSTETGQGRVRMEETHNVPLKQMLREYTGVFRQVLKTPATLRILALVTLLQIQQMIASNFFSLYVTQDLGVPEYFLARFPILRAAIMLIFFLGVQQRLDKFPIWVVMLTGLGVYIGGHALLLITPPGAITMLVIFTAMDAVASALFLPRRDTLFILNTDAAERARVMSLVTVIMLGVSSPFGYLAGILSGLDRRIPFAVCLVLFILMSVMVIMERKTKHETDG